MKQSVTLLLLSTFLITCQPDESSPDFLNSFEIEDGFQIELMAMEPLISDPVDMEIDELGRWFVVEMHGYPLDLSASGKVKRLADTDGDGLPDKSTVFIDSLILPTGIMRWKKGFLVTDPPNVLYLEDTNNDGRADVKEIILTGFARSNPQHNVNNPVYGIDNWIYLSHEGAVGSKGFADVFGDRGSDVHFPNMPNSLKLPQNANGLGVRFKPNEGMVETLSAKGQFGHAFDPWGHHFLTSNADHLFHEVIGAPYIRRNKNLLIRSGRVYIPKSGKGFEIYPITENPDHQLLTDVGMMTSACGITWYNGGIFPSEYNNTIFTAEPVHNMIHVDRIIDKGATFESINLLENKEFLASKDSWFRPVNHYVGPDGAIYVLDYHRKVIEHPEWLSDEVINSGDLYAGKEKGRIYRISPKNTPTADFLDKIDLGSYKTTELIELLNHSNSWWRTHAQRLLMDRSDPNIIQELVKSTTTNLNEFGKAHAIWLLHGKGALTSQVLLDLLDDESPNVREQAIKLSEIRLSESDELIDKLLAMQDDENAKVRYQLLLTLGELGSDASGNVRTEMLFNDIDSEWTQYAALSAKQINVTQLFSKATEEFVQKESKKTALFFSRISEMMSRAADSNSLNDFLFSTLSSSKEEWHVPIVLDGISNTLSRNKDITISKKNVNLLETKFKTETNSQIRVKSIELLDKIGYFKNQNNNLVTPAKNVSKRKESAPAFRADALRIIARTNADQHLELFNRILLNETNPVVRSAAIDAFGYTSDSNALQKLVSYWPSLLPDERSKGIGILLKKDEGKLLLLNSIQSNKINVASLSWPRIVQLLNSYNTDLRKLARSVLSGNELNSDSIWNEYKESLSLEGSTLSGEKVFKQSCGICHQKSGTNGTAFGPDLASIQNRSNSALLLDILQPNRSIADGFELWQLDLTDGSSLSGVISSESPSSITISMTGGQEQTINRTDIKSLSAFEHSAMPENLQAQMSPQEMADLLAYLKNN
jgi:putative membrane-bound dehydrogenase-like protein